MKPEPKKKLPNKKVISSAKFEAKEQFTKSALENLKTEDERLVNSLKKSGEIKESKRKQNYSIKNFLLLYYFIDWEMIEKISLANSHLPQLIGFVLMSIGYTLGNKFYLPEIKQKQQIHFTKKYFE